MKPKFPYLSIVVYQTIYFFVKSWILAQITWYSLFVDFDTAAEFVLHKYEVKHGKK